MSAKLPVFIPPFADVTFIQTTSTARGNVFVNRSAELFDALWANMQNHTEGRMRSPTWGHYALPYSSQCYGAGKTLFLQRYVEQLSAQGPALTAMAAKEYAKKPRRALPPAACAGDAHPAAAAAAAAAAADLGRFTAHLTEIQGAVAVVLPACTATAVDTLRALARELVAIVPLPLMNSPPPPGSDVATVAAYLEGLVAAARQTCALFLGVDEMGKLGGGGDPGLCLAEFRLLREALVAIVKNTTASPGAKPVHLLMAGRLDLQVAKGLDRQTSGSLIRNKRIFLEVLRPVHVAMVAHAYETNVSDSSAFLCPHDDVQRLALATAVCAATAGIPRMVHYLLATLAVLSLPLTDVATITKNVRRAAVAMAESHVELFDTQFTRFDEQEVLDDYLALLFCDIFNIALEPAAMSTSDFPEVRLQRRLLDSTRAVPAVFETTESGKKNPAAACPLHLGLAQAPRYHRQ